MPNRQNRTVAALTGSIATGKSAVLNYFKDFYGFEAVSADKAAHEILDLPEISKKICNEFGKSILNHGKIDRRLLGKIVFSDSEKLKRLNSIAHPAILKQVLKIIDELPQKSHVILEAAILIEAGWHKYFKTILLTTCKPEIQLARLMKRDKINEEEAKKRIASQLPFEEKKAFAAYVIDTSFGMETTKITLEKIAADLITRDF